MPDNEDFISYPSLSFRAPGSKWVGVMARRDPTIVIKVARKRNILTCKNEFIILLALSYRYVTLA